MKRLITVAAAQLGPIQRAEGRDFVVARMVRLLERAHQRGGNVVVFPELALTTFFPRWYVENLDEADGWYEESLPSPATQPLFDAIRRYGLTCYLGYAEIAHEPDEQGVMRKRRFNTSVVIAPSGEIVLKYRKVHLPGHKEFSTIRKVQHLEKRYFEVGNLGFPVVRAPVAGVDVNMGMLICNDRRWPESWRELGLQQVELVMLGYNTPAVNQENRGFEARAGLTKPQLHYYIAGKEELYEELLMQVLHAWKVVFSFEDASDPATVLGDYIRKKLDHAIDSPEISRIFTREILDGGRNLDRYWPNARAWTQKKIDVINGWIARGQMRPLDARFLLMHIWAMTQSYADYAIQTRVMLGLPPDAPFDREPIGRELVAFVLHGCGIEA